jgi:hypothetical protein
MGNAYCSICMGVMNQPLLHTFMKWLIIHGGCFTIYSHRRPKMNFAALHEVVQMLPMEEQSTEVMYI